MKTKRERFLVYLITTGNVPYIWGGQDVKTGLDCSGLAQLALDELNLDPPGDQTAEALRAELLKRGAKKVTAEEADLGDLVFYGNGKATHVTIALGERLALGANGGGRECTSAAIARAKGAKVKVHNIGYRQDLMTILRPAGLEW